MGELERYKKALDWVLGSPLAGSSQLVKVSIDEILNPPPEFETVEVVRWETTNRHGCPEWSTFADDAENWRKEGREVIELTGTFQRPKPVKVERSAEGVVSGRGGMVPTIYVTIPQGGAPMPGEAVTVTWQE